MDDKASRRDKRIITQRRPKKTRNYRRDLWKFVQTHKNAVLTCVLLTLLVVLLFGILSQLQIPTTSSAPDGATTVNYSTLMEQVQSGNVVAVAIQGDDINALLADPLTQSMHTTTHIVPPSNVTSSPTYHAWSQTVGIVSTSWLGNAGLPALDPQHAIYSRIPANGMSYLTTILDENHVQVNTLSTLQTAGWISFLQKIAPLLIIAVLIIVSFTLRNKNNANNAIDNRISQLGKNRARRFVRNKENTALQPRQTPGTTSRRGTSGKDGKGSATPITTIPGVTFADVAGIDEVRAELTEMVDFLRNPERYNRLGARIPRGALLVGAPGTGKTLLAKAVAGEANVPFFSMSASEFVEMFVGVGASRVRDLFAQARAVSPCVVFLDEIDAVGRKRSVRAAGNDERDQTLNQLLVELDGFDARQAVVVLAATNRADILDQALLRPGRFDRRITVSAPDRVGREAILRVHARNTPLHADLSLERLSRLTTGMTGADLANLVNEAALAAVRRDLENVTHDCFEEALARVQLGALRPLVMSEHERRIIAVHEGGHALVAHHLPEADTVNRVTILPRGQSLGVTQFTAEVDRYNYSRETLMARIAVGLGGRTAEEITFGLERITTGAENDLQVVTDLARRMVTRWGMSEQVGLVFADYQAEENASLNMRRADYLASSVQARSLVVGQNGAIQLHGSVPEPQPFFASAASAAGGSNGVMMNALIDAEVQRILNEGHALARQILTTHNDELTLLADQLIEHEQLDRAQFEALFSVEE